MKGRDAISIACAVACGLVFLDMTIPTWLRYCNLGSCFINVAAGLWTSHK